MVIKQNYISKMKADKLCITSFSVAMLPVLSFFSFAKVIFQVHAHDIRQLSSILQLKRCFLCISDDEKVHVCGTVNRNNCCVWGSENPHMLLTISGAL
jgi:hypothetical protein